MTPALRTLSAAVAAALSVSAAAGPVAAQGGDTPVAVLGIEATDAPETLAAELTDALRQRVAATKGYALVPGKDLVEVKLVFSCPDEAPPCMAQAAKSLGAQKLLFGSIKRSVAGDFVVTLKLLDAARASVDAYVAEPLPQKQSSGAAARGPVQKWFATLTGQNPNGIIRVRSSTPGATVNVDGNVIATTGREDTIVTDVPAGRHVVRLDKPGYRAVQQEVEVAPGATMVVPFRMVEGSGPMVTAPPTPGGGGQPAGGAEDGRASYRTGFWITLGAGLASAGAAIKFGTDVLSINRDLDPYRRFPCPTSTSPSGLCDKNGKPAQPLNGADQKVVTDKRDEGSRAQALQWVFVGVGSAFGIASAYLFYRGYLDHDTPVGERPASASRGLRIFPTAGASSGGVLAEFDF